MDPGLLVGCLVGCQSYQINNRETRSVYENKRMAAENSKASNADGCATPLELEKEAKIKKMPSCGRAEGSQGVEGREGGGS